MEVWREELYDNELYHFGIKGMKWGVRRYQNPDGSYTPAGRRRYGMGPEEKARFKRGAAVAAGVAAGAAAAGGAAYGAKKAGIKPEDIFEQNIKGGKDKPNVSAAERISSKTGEGISAFGGAYSKAKKIHDYNEHGSKVTIYDDNLIKKSDAQLKAEINRMRDEVQWSDLNSKQINAGKATVMDYVEMAKDVAVGVGAIASTAGVIIGVIMKAKGRV